LQKSLHIATSTMSADMPSPASRYSRSSSTVSVRQSLQTNGARFPLISTVNIPWNPLRPFFVDLYSIQASGQGLFFQRILFSSWSPWNSLKKHFFEKYHWSFYYSPWPQIVTLFFQIVALFFLFFCCCFIIVQKWGHGLKINFHEHFFETVVPLIFKELHGLLEDQNIIQYSLPDCYKKMSKKCSSPRIFSGLVVFFGVFFRKLQNVIARK